MVPLSPQCQSPPCFLNPSNQALENAIQFLCSLDILPPISRTLPLYSKMNSEKRVPLHSSLLIIMRSHFLNSVVDIHYLTNLWILDWMESECNPPPSLAWIAYRVRRWHSALSIFFVQNIKALSFHLKGLTFFEQIYQVSEKKILACWA